ncbi:MAG: DMT family transporter [Syntrophobacterales bacterium]|nr:DMT family transporter [Syntrophobacterales bacterium]
MEMKRSVAWEKTRLFLALGIAICAISCASLLIRLTDAPPLSIAFYRVMVATFLYFPLAIKQIRIDTNKYHLGPMILGGLCLASHFGFWISSLSLTSVASSVTLVNTSPIFVIIASKIFKSLSNERSNRPTLLWIGVTFGIFGTIGLTGSDFISPQRHSLLGDLLAIMGAISLAGYLLIGRIVGTSLPLATYLTGVYGSASIMLLVTCLLTSSPLIHFSWDTFLMLFLVGIVPQGIGHSLLNWALRRLPALLVSLLIIAEPIGATILAGIFLKEYPPVTDIISMGLIVTGIFISQRAFSDRGP